MIINILYIYNKMDTQQEINILKELEPFMFYKNNLYKRNPLDTTPVSNPPVKKELELSFIPHERDSLFWCFYVIQNGYSAYECLFNRNNVTEKTMKIEYVEHIRKHKDVLKQHKFSTITHLENQLANEYVIDVSTFLSMCAVEGKNVCVIRKKTYIELNCNPEENKYYIVKYYEEKKRYGLEPEPQQNSDITIDKIRDTYYLITNMDKPLNSMTSYKLEELIDITQRLEVKVVNQEKPEKKPTKKDYYEKLVQTLTIT
jgi:hypothetical protein